MQTDQKARYMRAVLLTVSNCVEIGMSNRGIASRLEGLKLGTITRLNWTPQSIAKLMHEVRSHTGSWGEAAAQLMMDGRLPRERLYPLLAPQPLGRKRVKPSGRWNNRRACSQTR